MAPTHSESEAQFFEQPPLDFFHAVYYEVSSYWWLALPLPFGLSEWLTNWAIKRYFPVISTKHRRYLAHYLFGQQQSGVPSQGQAKRIDSIAEAMKLLYETPVPELSGFHIYELLTSTKFEELQGDVAAAEAYGQFLEKQAAVKYQRFLALYQRGRRSYLKAALNR
jgi:hypothetical protein